MHMQSRSLIGAGLLSLAMAFSLAGCGGGASAPAEDPAPQEEAAAEAEGTAEDEAAADGEAEDTVADADAAEADADAEPDDTEPALAEGLTLHENDLLTIGIADGWDVYVMVDEVERFESEGESGYSFTLQHEDESLGRRLLNVNVYDEETYEWATYDLPPESDNMRDIQALGPLTISGAEFTGYRSLNTGLDGTEYHFLQLAGVVNGHYVEIYGTDGSADGVLFDDEMLMAQSLHIK